MSSRWLKIVSFAGILLFFAAQHERFLDEFCFSLFLSYLGEICVKVQHSVRGGSLAQRVTSCAVVILAWLHG